MEIKNLNPMKMKIGIEIEIINGYEMENLNPIKIQLIVMLSCMT